MSTTLSQLNPEAGDHPIPDDPRQLQAAEAAARRCWAEYPYLERRYGERGLRFTLSDGAWLATLAGAPATQVHQQVGWLARLLAARGMPRRLLERKLELLGEAFAGLGPGGPGGDRLLEAAASLARPRREHLSDADLAAVEAVFQAEGGEAAAALRGTGELLAGEVADRAQGLDAGPHGLAAWLARAGVLAGAVAEAEGEARRRCLPPG